MKKIILVVVTMICLLSCYEVNEEIVINENGSGTFTTKMDMGQMLDMIMSMAGEEEIKKQGMDQAIDTTILMKSILDSAKDATAEQKELIKDGKMNLQMNMKEKVFKAQVYFPFTSYDNLQKLMSGAGNSAGGFSQIFKGVFDKKEEPKQQLDAPKEPNLEDLSNIFDVVVKNGTISKKVNQEKYKALMAQQEVAQMKEMGAGGMEILYTTSIKLPRPVKRSDNPLIKLSDDKKTVTLKYNLLDLFNTPEKFSYTIEY